MLLLRCLNPATEIDLFREAYEWRTRGRDRMPFESFAADDPSQIVMGLFNGQLEAVYFFHQYEPGKFEAHFTSNRKAPKQDVLAGAHRVVQILLENGATEITAWVMGRSLPLQRFVETLGFHPLGTQNFGSARFVRYSKT